MIYWEETTDQSSIHIEQYYKRSGKENNVVYIFNFEIEKKV